MGKKDKEEEEYEEIDRLKKIMSDMGFKRITTKELSKNDKKQSEKGEWFKVKDNKFRAVLTVFASQKVLEIRFDDLNEDKTKISININDDNRHNVDGESFTIALLHLTKALNRYADNITIKMILNKIMGMV